MKVVCNCLYVYVYFYFDSDACLIKDQDSGTVIVTGGTYTRNIVSRYSISGWEEDLHPLNVGRNLHGCGSYIDNEDRVSAGET